MRLSSFREGCEQTMYELYLAHHGILGQRWGVRRFQNKDGSLTDAGEKRYFGRARHTPSSARKQAKRQAAELEKARKAEAEKKAFEEAKQKALTSGNATDVLKFQGHLTNKELQDAYNRINSERLLKDISAKETAKGKSIVDRVIDTTDRWRERGEKVSRIWNFAAKIHNSLVDEDDAWQIIGEKSVAEARKERAKQKAKEQAEEKRSIAVANFVKKHGSYDQLLKSGEYIPLENFETSLQRFATPKNLSRQSKTEKANIFKTAISKGWINVEVASKFINNEYTTPEMAKQYVENLRKEKEKASK